MLSTSFRLLVFVSSSFSSMKLKIDRAAPRCRQVLQRIANDGVVIHAADLLWSVENRRILSFDHGLPRALAVMQSASCAWDEIAIIADVDGDDSRSARIGVREGVCLNASECSPACLA